MLLPVGLENFEEIIQNNIDFVDKSLLIKAILDDKVTKALVFTRPRRFGKTLNLSMLHHFLAKEVYGQSTQGLFDNLKIAQCGEAYMRHQGRYPVISLTLKNVQASNYKDALASIAKLLSNLYAEYLYLLTSPKLSEEQKRDFKQILDKTKDVSELTTSLQSLTKYLFLHHHKKPWLLIDEYDTPIQTAYMEDYYSDMIKFMRSFMGTSLKTNPYIEKAVITGILRIAKESLFSEVNNLEIYSLLSKHYSEYFGFTETEVDDVLNKTGLTKKAGDIKNWYNGYQFGETVIYNPWSIAKCIKEQGELKPYWVNTSDNKLIKDLLKKSSLDFRKDFELLMKGELLEQYISEHLVFQYLDGNPDAIWSLLLMSGYLKPVSSETIGQRSHCFLSIPNQEVYELYRQIVEEWLSDGYSIKLYYAFIDSLLSGKIDEFKKHLEKIIVQIASYHDMAKEPEAFYHGLMLGFTASLHSEGEYEIKSNREAGRGRYDIMLIPKDTTKLGIIMELKAAKEKESLAEVAKKALQQITEKKYSEEMHARGIHQLIKIGIGFCSKQFALCDAKEPDDHDEHQ